MTPREPDRFDTEARAVLREADASAAQVMWLLPYVAAALRAAESSALERAAQIVEQTTSRYYSGVPADAIIKIRALIPPAAAPAAEPDVCVGSERIGGYLVPKYAPAAEALKAQAWSAAIGYCEEMFSPEWLADPCNRGIFAAHIYRLLNAARAAPPEKERK